MAKFGPIKGWFHEVGEPQIVGQTGNTFKVQRVIFLVPGRTDGFGEKAGEDEPWLIEITGDAIGKMNLTKEEHEGKKAIINIYQKGYAVEAKGDKPAFFGYRVNLADFKLAE